MIDAHVHVWRPGQHGCTWPPPSLAAIHRDFLMEHWRGEAAGATGAVLVQSQEDASDTAWLLTLAEQDPGVLGVVGWTDLAAPDAPAAIARLARHPRLKGLRPMVQGRPANWFDDPRLEPGWAAMEGAGLVLDALVRPAHLPSLARLAARRPGLRIVIDHAAKPVLGDLTAWHRNLSALARHDQVACKLSGLLTELAPHQPASAIEPAVAALVALFGPDRLIWGSDWPVLTLAGGYAEWLDQARALVPADQHETVFGDTARAVYGLSA